MYKGVAGKAEGDQVLLGILTALATKLLVVYLEVGSRSAILASPAITA